MILVKSLMQRRICTIGLFNLKRKKNLLQINNRGRSVDAHCSSIIPLAIKPNDGTTIPLLDITDLGNVNDDFIPVRVEDAN